MSNTTQDTPASAAPSASATRITSSDIFKNIFYSTIAIVERKGELGSTISKVESYKKQNEKLARQEKEEIRAEQKIAWAKAADKKGIENKMAIKKNWIEKKV